MKSRPKPYIWVTWLSKLLAGEDHCEWAAWFKAHFQDYEKVPSDFDSVAWQVQHNGLLGRLADRFEAEGAKVTIENQNSFKLECRNGATLAGKPDIVTLSDKANFMASAILVVDAKTGKARSSHATQVMIYMYALPKAVEVYRDKKLAGLIAYQGGGETKIPGSACNESFTRELTGLIERVGARNAARKVPSKMECRFCDIARTHCPERFRDYSSKELT